ncbi:hypothetical protein EJ997_10240 [Flaviflexus ciconiae]|uniref:Major capsid protein n=1 Tax=Flaviflexus ciconiae TaxID=2496867 RepID=A0A3S9PZ90_9ACTO|nr:hypothetical protein [Flaviflexus ciconiae]AZQ77662.1 hypothetical protein EJ997_10240 [Flaviflexus ciconiae]
MAVYPMTQSQVSAATSDQVLTFLQRPTLVARRLSEILAAQQFLSLFLLTGRFPIQGGAIAVPKNESIRTKRGTTTVAPGAEYQLTTMNDREYDIYTSSKEGIATEVTDEEVSRSAMQPIQDALAFLQTEMIFSADDVAMGVIASSVTQSHTGATWDNGKAVLADAEAVKAKARALRLGYQIDTAVLPGELYAAVLPELIEILPSSADNAVTGAFPTIGGITWVSDDTGTLSDPLFVDRQRLGGVARESIQSPGYAAVGNDTGVEIKTFRVEGADKTRIQARNPHVPIVTNPLAGYVVGGVS